MALIKLHDYILDWIPAGSRCESQCQVQVFRHSLFSKYWVILTELPNNPGRSVTNGIEEIAALLHERHTFLYTPTFIEHYTRVVGFEETWDLVEWREYLKGPSWRRVGWCDVAKMISAEGEWIDL